MNPPDPHAILEGVVRRGVRAAADIATPHVDTPTGIRRPKTRTERYAEHVRLDTIVEVLDLDFRWYGAWGMTRHAIRQELIRLDLEGAGIAPWKPPAGGIDWGADDGDDPRPVGFRTGT